MRTVPPATAAATTMNAPIPRRMVEAGSAGSLVVKADALNEVALVNDLEAPVEDDDAVLDELVELVVEDVPAADALETVVEEVVDDAVDVEEALEDVDVVEDVEEIAEDDVVEDDVDIVELVVVEEEAVDEVELVALVDVESVKVDCTAIVKYAVRVMLWVSVTVCAWVLLPPLQSSKT
jgi:hypothetical protein